MLIEYVKKTGLMEKWKDVIEFLTIEVGVYNTFKMLTRVIDHPDLKKLSSCKTLLKKEFPKWSENVFYKKKFSKKKKTDMFMLMALPARAYVFLKKLIQ